MRPAEGLGAVQLLRAMIPTWWDEFVRYTSGWARPRSVPFLMSSSPEIDADVKKTLDLRLVRGEITKQEYEAMLGTLRQSAAPFSGRSETARPSFAVVGDSPPPPRPASATPPPPAPAADPSLRAIGLTKSYIGAAFLSWLLYYVGFYLIGFIVNLCFLSSAKRIKNETGINPSGRGFLQFVFFIHFWLPLIFIGVLVFFGAQLGLSLSGVFQDLFHSLQRLFR